MQRNIVLPDAAERQMHSEHAKTAFVNFRVHGAEKPFCLSDEKNIAPENADSMQTAD